MLKLAIALTAALGMAQVACAQAPAGDQGSPGTSTNRNQGGTAQRGSGTQGTATNNQSGQAGSARAGQNGQDNNAGTRSGQTGQAAAGTGVGGTANQGGRSGQMATRNIEGHAADCLILKNEEEIQLLQSAQSKIQNDELKQAAQKMIQDHQQAIRKLQRFAMHRGQGGASQTTNGSSGQGAAAASAQAGAGTTGGATTRDPSANTTGASGTSVASRDAGRGQTREALRVGTDNQGGAGRDAASGQDSATAGGQMGGSPLANALFQVAQREKEECLKLTQEDLNKHEGAKFDKALAGQQCVMHGNMLAKLRALQSQQSSSEFGQLVQELEKTTQQHKEHIDQLLTSLDKGSDRGSESSQKRR